MVVVVVQVVKVHLISKMRLVHYAPTKKKTTTQDLHQKNRDITCISIDFLLEH
jgi:hypothetical protein